jgi:pilus assembly protein CpaE
MQGKSARTSLFGFDGMGEIKSRLESIDWVCIVGESTIHDIGPELDVDIALVNLESSSGMDTVKRLAQGLPAVKVIGVGSSDPTQIINAMRAGCSQFVTVPIEETDLKNAFLSARPSEGRKSKRICVVGTSSGAGATTVACNLAVELASLPSSCAIVDLDVEFGGVASAFDCDPRHTIANLCSSDNLDSLDQQKVAAAMEEVCGVSILARPGEMSEVHSVDPEGVSKTLAIMDQLFDFVIVDLSRINGLLGLAAIRNSDYVVIVVQPNVMCARNAERAQKIIINEGIDPKNIGIVINRASSAGNVEYEELQNVLKSRVIGKIPNDYSSVSMSLDTGFASSEASGAVREAIRDLAVQVAGVRKKDNKSAGLLKRLFRKKAAAAQ